MGRPTTAKSSNAEVPKAKEIDSKTSRVHWYGRCCTQMINSFVEGGPTRLSELEKKIVESSELNLKTFSTAWCPNGQIRTTRQKNLRKSMPAVGG